MNESIIKDNAPSDANIYFIDEDGDVQYFLYKEHSKTLLHIKNGRYTYAHDPQDKFDLSQYTQLKFL